jgi:hypothetical protein
MRGSRRSVGFTPASLPNLRVWYDGRSPKQLGGFVPPEGVAIQTWKDISGGGRDAVSTSGARWPFYSRQNRSLHFDGIDDEVVVPTSSSFYPITIYLCVVVNSLAASARILNWRGVTPDSGITVTLGTDGTIFAQRRNAGTFDVQVVTTNAVTVGVHNYIAITYSSTSVSVRLNGTTSTGTGSSATPTWSAQISVFSNNGALWLPCYAGGILMYAAAHTTTQTDQVIHWMQNTWHNLNATVSTLYECDYGSNVITDYMMANTGSYNPTPSLIVTSPAPPAPLVYCGQYSVPGDGQRCEDLPLGWGYDALPYVEGGEFWFGDSIWLPVGHPVNVGGSQTLIQWKNNSTGSPPLEVCIGQNSNYIRVQGGYGNPLGPRLTARNLALATFGVWNRVVLHIKFSRFPATSLVEVWWNGTQVVSGYQPDGGTLYPTDGTNTATLPSYQKFGYYRDQAFFTTAAGWGVNSVMHSDFKIGTSYAAVA